MADLKTVCDYLTPSEILAQLGEECAEGTSCIKIAPGIRWDEPHP